MNDDFNFFSISKDIELFVPSITFHFSKSLSDINYKEIMNEIIPKDMIIINIERGSTLLTIAFISSGKVENTVEKYKELFEPLIKYFHRATGNSIAGNFEKEPIFTFPNEESVKSFFERESINLLQLNDILDQIDFKDIQDEVKRKLRRKIENTNWEFIFANQEMYNEAEESVRNSIENNEVELIITGITIIANKDHNSIKYIENGIPDKVELFLYHGSEVQNHSSIIKNGFLLPDDIPLDEDEINYRREFGDGCTDPGYFGKGFYATDNIFYASMYSKPEHKQYLKYNETGSIICCKTIFSRKYCVNLNDHVRKKSDFYEARHIFFGNEMHPDIVENYGAHLIYVESSTKFHPIGINRCMTQKDDRQPKKDSYVTAFEYVFPRKVQIAPVFSISVYRPRFFVLWFNKVVEFDQYYHQIKHSCEFNIYCKNNLDDAVGFVDKKKRNKLKLIVSVDDVESCKEIIEKIRECHLSNFICLIFSKNLELLNLAISMENVLFTDQSKYLKKFIKIKLIKEKILNFSQKLSKCYNSNDNLIKFNINRNNLLQFYDGKWC